MLDDIDGDEGDKLKAEISELDEALGRIPTAIEFHFKMLLLSNPPEDTLIKEYRRLKGDTEAKKLAKKIVDRVLLQESLASATTNTKEDNDDANSLVKNS